MNAFQIIRPKELAEILSVSIPTLYRMMDDLPPKIKLSKHGRAVGWRHSDIVEYLESRQEKREPETV